MPYKFLVRSNESVMVLPVQEIQKLRYHLHFIVKYLENYVSHGHVKMPKSRSVSCNANIKQLPSKELRRMQNSVST